MQMPIKRNDGLNAVQRYQAKCDCITIRPLKEVGEAIRSAASAAGLNTTQFIVKAVFEYIENHSEQ